MKLFHKILTGSLLLVALLKLSGCKYDVAEPVYYDPHDSDPASTISSVEPAGGAVPGVNTITIHGENFEGVLGDGVYFDKEIAEVISNTGTTLTVRRPNLVSADCLIKVVSSTSISVSAKFNHYKVDKVFDPFGAFVDNIPLGGIDIDANDNLYVTAGRTIYKVTSSGDKTVVGISPRNTTQGRVGPDGNLHLMVNTREIYSLDLSTPSDSNEAVNWHRLSTSKPLRVGAFDSEGNFYTGGTQRTELWVIHPDSTDESTGLFRTDSVINLHTQRVQGAEYLYVVAGTETGREIQRYPLSPGGNVGAKEVIVNLAEFGFWDVTDMTVASSGKLFLSSNTSNSLIIYDPSANTADYFYKNIVPGYVQHIIMGSGNYLYIVSGDPDNAVNWSVYRVDLGVTKAEGFR